MPNTGEVTEDYSTFAKHLAEAFFAGMGAGVLLLLIGYHTTLYQQLGTGLLKIASANPLAALVTIGFFTLLGFVYFKYIRKHKSGGEKKK